MSGLWQLKRISNGEVLNLPQPLPENWGPMFGLHGFLDKLSDLSWLGSDYEDKGWFVVGEASTSLSGVSTPSELAWSLAKKLLAESDWSMLPDVPMTHSHKTAWIEYRRALRDIRLQAGFPNEIQWPLSPE